MDREVIEKRTTTIKDTSVPNGQTTNVNLHPDGTTDVQVNEAEPVVEERTTVTTRREI